MFEPRIRKLDKLEVAKLVGLFLGMFAGVAGVGLGLALGYYGVAGLSYLCALFGASRLALRAHVPPDDDVDGSVHGQSRRG